MSRRTTGAAACAVGVLLMTGSAYLTWYSGEAASSLPIAQLVQATPEGAASSYWRSLAAPLAILGGVGLLGAAIRSRVLLGFAWLIGVTTLVLWAIMRAIAKATDKVDEAASAGVGPLVCVVGTVIVLAGIAFMGPRAEEVEAPLSVFDDDSPK